jgi:hypothetical protein
MGTEILTDWTIKVAGVASLHLSVIPHICKGTVWHTMVTVKDELEIMWKW